MKKKYAVRVVLQKKTEVDAATALIEQLRYAQLVTVHRDDAESICFDIEAPHGVESEVWAKMNAERMQTFGYNAQQAPSTRQSRI